MDLLRYLRELLSLEVFDVVKNGVFMNLFSTSELIMHLLNHPGDGSVIQLRDLDIDINYLNIMFCNKGSYKDFISLTYLTEKRGETLAKLLEDRTITVKNLSLIALNHQCRDLIRYSENINYRVWYMHDLEEEWMTEKITTVISDFFFIPQTGSITITELLALFPNSRHIVHFNQYDFEEFIFEFMEEANEIEDFRDRISYCGDYLVNVSNTELLPKVYQELNKVKELTMRFPIEFKLTVMIDVQNVDVENLKKIVNLIGPKEIKNIYITNLSNTISSNNYDWIEDCVNVTDIQIEGPILCNTKTFGDLKNLSNLNSISFETVYVDYTWLSHSLPQSLNSLKIRQNLSDLFNEGKTLLIPGFILHLEIEDCHVETEIDFKRFDFRDAVSLTSFDISTGNAKSIYLSNINEIPRNLKYIHSSLWEEAEELDEKPIFIVEENIFPKIKGTYTDTKIICENDMAAIAQVLESELITLARVTSNEYPKIETLSIQ